MLSMKYNQIRKLDIQNGPGCRVSLFTSGCPIHCDGCFNYEAWSFNTGKTWSVDSEKHFLELCNRPQIHGISILGGEPLIERNLDDLKHLFIRFKEMYPEKDIWLWTGYKYEELSNQQLDVVNHADILIDGPWIDELGDFKLKYRGSSNQRIINIKKTIEEKQVSPMF